MRLFPRGGGGVIKASLWSWEWKGEGGRVGVEGTKKKKSMGWVSLKGLSAFGIMIQWKYCVADCCRIFLHRRKNYSPWWSVNVFLFLPVLSIVKTASAYLLSPQNIRRVPCLFTSISVLWLQWASTPSPLPCFSGDSPHPEWDVIATIGLYNIVHKSSLCECTFDKVYLFICKHLIINRQYI